MHRFPRPAAVCPPARRWGNQPLALLAVAGVVCGVLSGFSGSARADDLAGSDNSIAALRSYVQLVAAAQPQTAVQGTASGEIEGYATLRAFAQRIGSGPLPSIKDQPKLAEADNLLDWLKQGAPAPAAAPPPVAAPRATVGKAPGAVEATYIGSKVCLGCHSAVGGHVRHHADGPAAADGQIAGMRDLSRPGFGTRQGRRRPRRRRHHFVPRE